MKIKGLPDGLILEFCISNNGSKYYHPIVRFVQRRSNEGGEYFSTTLLPDWMRNFRISGQTDNETDFSGETKKTSIYCVRPECEFNSENGVKVFTALCKKFKTARENAHQGLTFGQMIYYFAIEIGIESVKIDGHAAFNGVYNLKHGCYLIDLCIDYVLPFELGTKEIQFG